jgi:uncharacterized membrane protein
MIILFFLIAKTLLTHYTWHKKYQAGMRNTAKSKRREKLTASQSKQPENQKKAQKKKILYR